MQCANSTSKNDTNIFANSNICTNTITNICTNTITNICTNTITNICTNTNSHICTNSHIKTNVGYKSSSSNTI